MAELNQEHMTKAQKEYLRKERTREMRQQLVSFGLMIFLTFIAFGLAALEVIPAQFTIPIVIGFAFIQVILQFYYFMHMKDRGHQFAKLFMLTGFYFALAFIVAFIYIVWIGAPVN
ncbi:cytochrome C oxidase subunit IV family protein [Lacicoccus alkaliphilus]|uniref:Cytochrome c oxidase subunit 4 n=1 Tax=Lacicoccus alkaliphilus DSM 16010 TaxID=1123231 RepID=A0A1M7CK74_9BACL|nr:cytochrome C oxidase subunit IV family protein [Salinicoccus alkaliphilus]SHL67239.1 cytochrome c oxidase subunit 4 [Salinicoccus alkaliphilus DSM 16010]